MYHELRKRGTSLTYRGGDGSGGGNMPGKQAHCVQPRQGFVLWHTRWSVGGHTGAGTDRQIGRLALRAAWASPSEIPKNTAPHRMLNVKARSIIEASLPIVPHRVADRSQAPASAWCGSAAARQLRAPP